MALLFAAGTGGVTGRFFHRESRGRVNHHVSHFRERRGTCSTFEKKGGRGIKVRFCPDRRRCRRKGGGFTSGLLVASRERTSSFFA